MHGSRTVGEELFREQRDVAKSVPEWGQQDVKDLQPVQKILTKRAAFNCVAKVLVARRDDAHVRLLESRPAEALILAFLDETGKVISAEIEDGPIPLRLSALEAARKAHFAPMLVAGQPVKVTGVITYIFAP